MHQIIEKGDIIRKIWPGDVSLEDKDYVNLYLGSGRFGGSFDAWGLMNRPYKVSGNYNESRANTLFMHADHWTEGHNGFHYHIPLARLQWKETFFTNIQNYEQKLEIYNGRISTVMESQEGLVKIISYFNPYNRDIFAMEIEYEINEEAQLPPLLLSPETDFKAGYGDHFSGNFNWYEYEGINDLITSRIKVGTSDTLISLKILSDLGEAQLEKCEDGISIHFLGNSGRHTLLIGVAGYHRNKELLNSITSIAESNIYSKQCVEAWHKRWGDSWVSIPVPEYQALWCRSVYYILCSYSPDEDCVSPPMGWTGNGWNFHFPQDFSYILPALLRLGHIDIAKAKVEFYRNRLENMQRNTQRIYKKPGVMWAWEFPIGENFEILTEEAPNWCQYEIHNTAYPARMAYETALHLNDNKWMEEVAWPIIRESTKFLVSTMYKEQDGTWGMSVEPSMGQDENGEPNSPNYLCALYSAKYCLKISLDIVKKLDLQSDEYEQWSQIYEQGLAFSKLYSEENGLYYCCKTDKDNEIMGKLKHPVPLNPLIFLPLEELEQPVINAYHHREKLCDEVWPGFVHGWTLAAYWLAACHMKEPEAMLKHFERMPGDFMDKDMLQFYESSVLHYMMYYTTIHGLYLQAINDALVSDFWGEVEIGAACPEKWENVKFYNLHTKDGSVLSGQKQNESWNIDHQAFT